MRVAIIGQKWFGAAVLDLAIKRGHAVTAAIAPALDDRLAGTAFDRGVPVAIAARALSAEQIPADTDVLLAAHCHAFVPAAARARTRFGALGYHPSLLPRHRGRDAIRWSIHMREPITGGTLYWMDDGADTGPIALQRWCHIRPEDTPDTLWRRELAPIGLDLFGRGLDLLSTGALPSVDQDEALATWEPAWISRRLSSQAA